MKILILILIMITGCKKNEPVICNNDCLGANYSNYSTNNFDYVEQNLVPVTPIGSQVQFLEDFLYGNPVFNPNNPYEIAYIKHTANNLEKELWKFSFCTGTATKIADNYYYNLDWGTNGWLLYTGTNHNIYKIKDNGDSLTVLIENSVVNNAGKWNPSSTHFFADGKIYYPNGEILKNISPSGPLYWINDSLLLVSAGLKLNSYSINTGDFIELNSNKIGNGVIYNRINSECYIPFQNGVGQKDYYVKYDLSGSNNTDTIKNLYDSYYYVQGSCVNNKIITTLVRQHWKDTMKYVKYVRSNIIIMDLDGTNERLINLP